MPNRSRCEADKSWGEDAGKRSSSTPASPSSIHQRRQFWAAVLRKWEDSGMQARAFCRREELSEPAFYWWRRKLMPDGPVPVRDVSSPARRRPTKREIAQGNSATPAAAFIPVSVTNSRPADSVRDLPERIEIAFPCGVTVGVRPGADRATLQLVLGVLREASC